MKLSEMKALLTTHDLRLTRSLGQNFLHDRNQLLRIVELAELQRGDRVLEIGPGLGPLTELLMERAGSVLAIEKDARLVRILEERFKVTALDSCRAYRETAEAEPLRLVLDDALEYLRRQPHNWTEWKVVSNLPYSVASPILVELAQCPVGPQCIVATLQLEVARRLAAQPGSPDYGILTLLAQLQYEPRQSFKIPASCFFPEPDVDSACICLTRRPQPLLAADLWPAFVRIVKSSFAQRRKMMLKLLKPDWPVGDLEKAFSQLQLSPQTRAEALTLQQFVRLTELLVRHSPN